MKPSRTVLEQVDLLKSRGLIIKDEAACGKFLEENNYYRFSGYARYFQRAPHLGDEQFLDGISFEEIREIFDLDAYLRSTLTSTLAKVELLLRTHLARSIAYHYSPYQIYLEESFYVPVRRGTSTVESIISNIDRSREYHILRFSPLSSNPRSFDTLPIWSAVEVFSFGTLSKCIERGASGKLQEIVAESIGARKAGFASRVRAAVYLRNRCFHHGRLWNHFVVDSGVTPTSVRRRAKQIAGQFEPQSVLDVIASLDDLAARSGISSPILPNLVRTGKSNSKFWDGLSDPQVLAYRH